MSIPNKREHLLVVKKPITSLNYLRLPRHNLRGTRINELEPTPETFYGRIRVEPRKNKRN